MSVHVFFDSLYYFFFSTYNFAVSPSGSTPIESVIMMLLASLTLFYTRAICCRESPSYVPATDVKSTLSLLEAVVSLDFAWSFAGFIIYIFLLTHNNIKHHHQHETYGEADGAEIAVLAA